MIIVIISDFFTRSSFRQTWYKPIVIIYISTTRSVYVQSLQITM